ncbi:MAG: DUF932 domain-containing protein [Proteobacteria bacterium]|nr:DUF932 domain-containing protein [Pseudomonadota bacterium]
MNGLMLHCGADAIGRNELTNVMPPEAMGAHHNPVPYIDYVNEVSHNLDDHGYAIHNESFGVHADGGSFFGLMEIKPKVLEGEYLKADNDDDFGLMVGLRGSYNQSIARGLAIGSRVFVCDNLAFSGEVTINTRQTTHIARRLPRMINGAMGQLLDLSEKQEQRFDRYKDMEFKPRWGDAAIVECVRRKVITPTQVNRVVQEWDQPTHDEHAEHGHSLWRFHNAVTEAIKPVNGRAGVVNNQNRTIKLTSFLDEVAGF